jgi:hypothetical protein
MMILRKINTRRVIETNPTYLIVTLVTSQIESHNAGTI